MLNYIANERHYNTIKQAVELIAEVPVLGSMRKHSEALLPERHMGLVSSSEFNTIDTQLNKISEYVKKYIDIDKIENIAKSAPAIQYIESITSDKEHSLPLVKIGIIRDRAFQFYYPENLEELKRLGAQLIK
ncbi:cobyrinic acid a,c-diamide synthase [Candidatus Magnetoovum chiemensis]|nr:cobyrinic acid a,c-diamide synthase [Candidatus Magnetoovum chiemensis]